MNERPDSAERETRSHAPGPKSETWWTSAQGYICGRVWMNGKQRHVRKHRLVMENHLGRKLLPSEDVHHINGDKADNRVGNLRVVDHGKYASLSNAARWARLTAEQVAEIWRDPRQTKELAALYGVHRTTIQRIRRVARRDGLKRKVQSITDANHRLAAERDRLKEINGELVGALRAYVADEEHIGKRRRPSGATKAGRKWDRHFDARTAIAKAEGG